MPNIIAVIVILAIIYLFDLGRERRLDAEREKIEAEHPLNCGNYFGRKKK